MDNKQLQLIIDRCIKDVWLNNISQDYKSYYLLKEDTLKNALYFHLRTRLQNILAEHNIRIYTEYHYKGFISDIAVVKLKEDVGETEHLKDGVDSVLSIIEVKYKNGGSTAPFESDVSKIKQYIELKPLDKCQFYLAFIHEVVNDASSEKSWLTIDQKNWARGKLTELNGYFEDNNSELVVEILSHNDMNTKLPATSNLKIYRKLIEEKAARFNEKKYNHEYYHHYLNVVQEADSVTDKLIEAIENLFYWKLGKVSVNATASSKPVTFSYQQHYFINGTTGSNNQSIQNATKMELLELGLSFRDGLASYDNFKAMASDITQTTSSVVLPSFLVHIFKPDQYPILDVKVWRAFLWAYEQPISKYTKPRSWGHYEKYREFFRETEEQTALSWRVVDKGLWVIGDGLKVNV